MTALDTSPCILTDKEQSKTVPCIVCGRPCVVHAFAANQSVRCTDCRTGRPGIGGQTVVQPGKTPPENVRDLSSVLINEEFAEVACPFGHGPMELKSVNHNPYRGPAEKVGYKDGRPVYQQHAPGETVMHQCNECKCTVSLSTAHVHVYRRQNEPRRIAGDQPSVWTWANGVRREAASGQLDTPVAGKANG